MLAAAKQACDCRKPRVVRPSYSRAAFGNGASHRSERWRSCDTESAGLVNIEDFAGCVGARLSGQRKSLPRRRRPALTEISHPQPVYKVVSLAKKRSYGRLGPSSEDPRMCKQIRFPVRYFWRVGMNPFASGVLCQCYSRIVQGPSSALLRLSKQKRSSLPSQRTQSNTHLGKSQQPSIELRVLL